MLTSVVLDVPVPPIHTTSGTVTVNAPPQLDPVGGFCTGTTATLNFVHATDTRFNAITSVSCTGFAWTVSLYPGTYQRHPRSGAVESGSSNGLRARGSHGGSPPGAKPRTAPAAHPAAVLAIGALYAAVVFPMSSTEEKLHFLEYGAVAVLAFFAAPEAWTTLRRFAFAALFTAAAGWLDEGIQALIPSRHYDLRDDVVRLNFCAASNNVGTECQSPGVEGSTMSEDKQQDITEPTLWRKNGWTARVIPNEGDEGWAVEIRKDGLSEPALISPWVMGRDKKNPKPFDEPAFATFVKTASEVLDRSARQRDQALKKKLAIAWEGRWYDVTLEQVPDEYEPHAFLSAVDDAGKTVAKHRVDSNFKFNRDVANAWVRGGFNAP